MGRQKAVAPIATACGKAKEENGTYKNDKWEYEEAVAPPATACSKVKEENITYMK